MYPAFLLPPYRRRHPPSRDLGTGACQRDCDRISAVNLALAARNETRLRPPRPNLHGKAQSPAMGSVSGADVLLQPASVHDFPLAFTFPCAGIYSLEPVPSCSSIALKICVECLISFEASLSPGWAFFFSSLASDLPVALPVDLSLAPLEGPLSGLCVT